MAEARFAALKTLRQQPAEPTEPTSIDEGRDQAIAGPVKVEPAAHTPRRPGRPNGKRSDPDYERMNLIVKKDTRRKVDMKLLQEGKSEDLSELVDRLLREWAG